MKMMKNNMLLIQGNCLERMEEISDGSIDMIFTDLPYGTTKNLWDIPLDLDILWKEYKRIIKENGCVALFAQSPYDKVLACSNLSMYRYEWIIEKTKGTGHLNAKRMPLKCHENILIFYKKLPTYNPIFTTGHKPVHNFIKHKTDGACYGNTKVGIKGGGSTNRYPRDVLKLAWDTQKSSLNQTQKPVAVCEYMIKTYTNEEETVLDSCMGSGTVGLACKHLNRKFIGIELRKQAFDEALERIEND